MDVVIDASAIIAVITHEPQRNALIRTTKGCDLLSPPSLRWEIGNAFSAMLRRSRVTLVQALQAIEAYKRIPIRIVEVELDDALTIAARFGIYAYDAYLIRCALRYNAPLVSLDQNLVRVAQEANAQVVEVIP